MNLIDFVVLLNLSKTIQVLKKIKSERKKTVYSDYQLHTASLVTKMNFFPENYKQYNVLFTDSEFASQLQLIEGDTL